MPAAGIPGRCISSRVRADGFLFGAGWPDCRPRPSASWRSSRARRRSGAVAQDGQGPRAIHGFSDPGTSALPQDPVQRDSRFRQSPLNLGQITVCFRQMDPESFEAIYCRQNSHPPPGGGPALCRAEAGPTVLGVEFASALHAGYHVPPLRSNAFQAVKNPPGGGQKGMVSTSQGSRRTRRSLACRPALLSCLWHRRQRPARPSPGSRRAPHRSQTSRPRNARGRCTGRPGAFGFDSFSAFSMVIRPIQ